MAFRRLRRLLAVASAMDLSGVAVPWLVVTLVVAGLAGCGQQTEAPASTARVGFCVGVDKSHPAGATATVTFKRGDAILGEAGGAAGGSVSIPVSPGGVTVYVDGEVAATLSVSAGGVVYATSGTGCPASMPS